MAKKKKQSWLFKFSLCFLCLVLGAAGGFYVISYLTLPKTEEASVTEDVYYSKDCDIQFADTSNFDADISIHFLELGNKYTGDCTFIQTKDADILIDCGSKSNSVSVVANYLKQYVTDGILEYVIVTHAHQDHYAGFATSEKQDSIFDLFQCDTIIDFALTNQKETSTMYKNYKRELAAEVANGAKHYTAQECIEGGENGKNGDGTGARSVFEIGQGITLNILNSYYYSHSASTENNYSVCCMFTQTTPNGDKNFLFTGDLEKEGEDWLVENNDLPERVELYKAGHHGSKTSSNEKLMAKIQPKVVCVCCCAGSSEYTSVKDNQFPTQDFINRIAPYTEKIYVTTLCVDYKKGEFTSFNGNIVFMSNAEAVAMEFSNNDTILKESDWFKQNRTWPSEKSA